MNDFRFKAVTVAAYYDEDTVFDSQEIEFSLYDVRSDEGEVFYVATTYGRSDFLTACYKDSVEPLYSNGMKKPSDWRNREE